MTNPEKCSKCESTQVINDVQVIDLESHAESLAVRVQTKPHAQLFKGGVRVPLKAQVCGTCGYTELSEQEFRRKLYSILRSKRTTDTLKSLLSLTDS